MHVPPLWYTVALTLMLLLAPSANARLGTSAKYRMEFQCKDNHNINILFRCASVETDKNGNKLCAGDEVMLNGQYTNAPYDPCRYSTCLGVRCPPEYPHLIQSYDWSDLKIGEEYVQYNYMAPRNSSLPRCTCAATKDGLFFLPAQLYIFPDGPESQPNDAVCKYNECGSMERFAHSPSGTGDDCTCCDKPTDKLSRVPPLPGATYAGCDPIDIHPIPSSSDDDDEPSSSSSSSSGDHNTDPPDAFVSTVRSMCGSAAASVSDSALAAGMDRFCCVFDTGVEGSSVVVSCGQDVVRVAGSFAVPAEAQCQSNIANQHFACCATVSAKGEQIANKGTTCSRGPGGGDGAPSPRSVAAACIMLLSAAWMAL